MPMDKHIGITLIRHGKTASNLRGVYAGAKTDDELDEAWMRDNCDTSLLTAGACKLFCGPLRRCRESAAYIFPDREPVIIRDMIETDFGDFEGKSYEELKDDPRYMEWMASGGRTAFPGGDDRDEFILRSMRGFREVIGKLCDDEQAVIMCHGGNIMAVTHKLLGGDYYDHMVGNLEGYKLELLVSDENITVISYDRISLVGGA